MIKLCVICTRPFDFVKRGHRSITCSVECSSIQRKAVEKKWRNSHKSPPRIVEKKCDHCGCQFACNKHAPYQRFCGTKCRNQRDRRINKRIWRAKNRDKIKAMHMRWRAKHPNYKNYNHPVIRQRTIDFLQTATLSTKLQKINETTNQAHY
jgi:hypothetical protein